MSPRAWLVLVLLATAAWGGTTKIVLGDGSMIVGRVVDDECTDKLLVVVDLRSRRKTSVPWSKVRPDIAHTQRVRLGFEAAETKGELRVAGHRVVNRSGKSFFGKLLNGKTAQQDGVFRLKTADGELRVPVSDVREGPTAVELDALEVYTPAELYQLKVAEAPPKTPEDHHRLADYCILVGAWEPAKTHLEAVLAAEGSRYNPDAVKQRLAMVEKRLALRAADDALRKIKRAIGLHRYEQATELLEAFRARYTDADLLAEAGKLEQRRQEARRDHYTREVSRRLRKEVRGLIEATVKAKIKEEWALSEAQRYAGGERSDKESATAAAVEEVAGELGIESQEVLDFWDRRPKRTIHTAFYRDGTFVVTRPDDPLSGRRRKGSSGSKKSGVSVPKPAPKVTPEQWWERKRKARQTSHLRDFLFAWWAEHSGMVELLEPKEDTCSVCAGRGVQLRTRPTKEGTVSWYDRRTNCHTARVWRIVRFR
ncbi:MAG: hypothetical protein ACE5JG_11840 [Planctomycetota bacterium]